MKLAQARTRLSTVLFTLALSACGPGGDATATSEAGTSGSEDLAALTVDALVLRAVDADPARAEDAIARLRQLGPEGHRALLDAHAATLAALREGPTTLSPEQQRLRHAIDLVSAQRDGHASGLYWYTDLDAARAEAARTGRPILALRLLGRLDEELSCANSRYFRTLLYPDDAVRRTLSTEFVLYWSSERPAPHITIDMGDGRTLERTITGNSLHYVLDAEGRLVDAIPGLFTAPEFDRRLVAARATADRCASADSFEACVRESHVAALAASEARWAGITARSSGLPTWQGLASARPRRDGDAPSATAAMRMTMSKLAVELPMLDLVTSSRGRPVPVLPVNWEALASTEYAPGLSDASLALLRLKTGTADVTPLAFTLARTASADSLLNEMTMHRTTHEWLADPATDLARWDAFNVRVYADLFLTPASDPWLGLRAGDVWDAVETADR